MLEDGGGKQRRENIEALGGGDAMSAVPEAVPRPSIPVLWTFLLP